MPTDRPARGQHHKGLAWFVAFGLATAATAAVIDMALPPDETLLHWIAAPQEDGSWLFSTIDGIDVSESGYGLRIRWGEIDGRFSGCGSIWGEASCVETPYRALLRRMQAEDVRIARAGDRLIATAPGHRAVLVRQETN